MAEVFFSKENRSYTIKSGTEFQRLCHLYPHILLKFGCRRGECGTCLIKILEGSEHVSSKTHIEIKTLQRLKMEDKRLACQCAIKGDMTVDICSKEKSRL